MARKAAVAESLLSIADISRHFSLPESTTRYYCKRFAQFIPSVGDGRRRRYRRETLEVISAILEQMQKSRTAAAVEDALTARFPRNAVAVADTAATGGVADLAVSSEYFPSAALQILERQTSAIEGIAHLLQLVVQRLPASGPHALRVRTSAPIPNAANSFLICPSLHRWGTHLRPTWSPPA